MHRRDSFRAENALVNTIASKSNVKFLWNSEIKEIKGDKVVRSAVIANNKTGEVVEIPVDGVFVQIGESPNSQLARDSGIQVDEAGRIKIGHPPKKLTWTVYTRLGDVTDHRLCSWHCGGVKESRRRLKRTVTLNDLTIGNREKTLYHAHPPLIFHTYLVMLTLYDIGEKLRC